MNREQTDARPDYMGTLFTNRCRSRNARHKIENTRTTLPRQSQQQRTGQTTLRWKPSPGQLRHVSQSTGSATLRYNCAANFASNILNAARNRLGGIRIVEGIEQLSFHDSRNSNGSDATALPRRICHSMNAFGFENAPIIPTVL